MIRVLAGPLPDIFSDWTVTVNGTPARVEMCRVSALPFNTPWKGHQRPLSQTEEGGFLRIVADETVHVRATHCRPLSRATVRPLSKNVTVKVQRNEVSFSLPQAGQYVLEGNDEHGALHVFVERPFDFSQYGKPTRVFGKGLHNAGKIELHSGDRIFLEEGARVKGVLFGKGVKNVSVFGYGVLDGGDEVRTSPDCYDESPNGCLKLYECENVRVEGVTFVDSAVWVCNLFACTDVELNRIKIVGHWKYNCDGIDIVNSSRVTVRDSFIRAFDDAITLKGIVPYRALPVQDITVENCVLWCGWGRTLEIGLETLAKEYSRISFTDCDLIHNSAVAIDIQCGDYAEIHKVTYKNLRVEFQKDTLPEQMEDPIGCAYTGYGKPYAPVFIKICSYEYLLGAPFEEYDAALVAARKESGRSAYVHDVVFEDVAAYVEEGCPTPSVITDMRLPNTMSNITMKNLHVIKI